MKEESKDLQKHGGINIKDFTPEKGYLPIVDLEEKDADLKSRKYDGFEVVEKGIKNVAIFDEKSILNFKKIL